jgi:hypothetical protein
MTSLFSLTLSLFDSPEHLRERANKAILKYLNSHHLNDAESEAIAQANSPLYLSPEINDFDDGLDIDDLMLLNQQSTPTPAPSSLDNPRLVPALVSQENQTYEPNSQLTQPDGRPAYIPYILQAGFNKAVSLS